MKYPVLVGKIGSMLSDLLDDEDYDDLISAGSIPEIASVLRKKGYGDFIPDIEDIHRRDLESFVQRKFYSVLRSLKVYVSYPEKKLLELVGFRCELDILKKVFRIFSAGEEFDERFLVCEPGFDPHDLLSSRSTDELIGKLSNRPYYSILSGFVGKDMFGTGELENALDIWYFSKLHRVIKSTGSKRILEFFEKQIDLLNLLWIYRGRFLFGYSPEVVLNYTIPFGRHVKSATLSAFTDSSTPEEFLERLGATPYSEIIHETENVPLEFVMDRLFTGYLFREARRMASNFLDGFEMLVGFIHLLEYEIRNITTVVETVRYSLGVEMSRSYIIRG